MSQLGRIGGKLLQENLERNGVDLTFRNFAFTPDPVLFLDVNNNRIGIATDAPGFDLQVEDIKATSAIGAGTANIANFVGTGDTISTTVGPINLTAAGGQPFVLPGLTTDDIKINDTTISSFANSDISFEPNNSGEIDLLGSVSLTGNLETTGSISLDGNLSTARNVQIGDGLGNDTVIINPALTQNLEPAQDAVFDLGSADLKWAEIHLRDQTTADNQTLFGFRVSDQLEVDGTVGSITSIQSNDNLALNADTGIYEIESFQIENSDITNIENTPVQLRNTGIGYVRFQGTNGILIPSGPNSERPANPEVGDTRWNTDLGYLEVFDGSVYVISIGAGDVIGAEEMEELGNLYSLILG
mgnify:CR=1 FL=1